MRFLERFRNEREAAQQNPQRQTGAGADGNLGELREAAQSLLAAGADAINRTLSHDSEAYLASTRQEGGQ